MNIFRNLAAILGAMLLGGRMAYGLCPTIDLFIPDVPAICLGETIEIEPVMIETEGDCNGMTMYPYKRWMWSVGGIPVDMANSKELPARFTPLGAGRGTIKFNLICRSRACPECNRNILVDKEFDVVHVGIAQSNCMVCWKETSAYLSVDPDTHAPDGVRWTSRPHGIYGKGNSIEFDPSQMTPRQYTVVAKNDGPPSCPDECEVHVVKVDLSKSELYLSAEDSEAALSLSSDSYSPGGYVWSSEPAGISSNGPNASIVFVPSNLPPGKYVVRCSSADLSDCYDECEVYILKVELVPDWNHDRKIDGQDREQATALNPYRFWINDDRDDGDVASGNSDLPGQSNGNAKDDKVNGRCDLLDFFPVWLDLGQALALLPPGGAIQYKLKQANDAVKAVYTDLDIDRAGKYLIEDGNMYGPLFNQDSYAANVFEVTSAGVVLENHFLQTIYANTNKGVLMVEGKLATANPLVLEILNNNLTIFQKELPTSLSSVEKMYRWINLRNAAGGGEARHTDLNEPTNNPDVLSNGKNFVFVHGYSVNEQAAKGWNAEIFKRLYWSGSRAKFYAVTWFGNDSQHSWLGGKTPDYHVNVVHALDTAVALASNLNNQVGGDITLAAHSLGNVLASAAITKHGANVARYLMIDGALAMEAFDGSPSLQDNNMWYTDWDPYAEWLWCSEWYANFPSGDGRHALTWRDYFSSGASAAYNFYSSGEDVLKTHPHTTYPGLWCYFGGEYAWALQEKRKGLNWISSIGGSTYGGWGFNDYYWDTNTASYVPPTNPLAILSRPFFRPGGSGLEDLYVPTDTKQIDVGSQYATNHLHFLLAGFIPSRTLAMGANRLTTWPITRNYNMQHTDVDEGFQNGWPSVRSSTDWCHSDLREVAYLYVYKLFNKFRDLGGLDQP